MTEFSQTIFNFISNANVHGPILILSGSYILYRIIHNILAIVASNKRNLKDKKRITYIKLIENIFKYAFILLAIFLILGMFGFDTRTLVAGLGILGLVIGFGLQDTIRDFISGFTIIVDEFFVVGDIIELRGFKGEVIVLGLRTTKVRNFSGEVQTFCNRSIDMVINYSQSNSQILFEIVTPHEIKVEKIAKILGDLIPKIEEIKSVEKHGVEYLGVKEVVSAGVNHMYKIKCSKTTASKIRREAIVTIKEAFDAKKIKVTIV